VVGVLSAVGGGLGEEGINKFSTAQNKLLPDNPTSKIALLKITVVSSRKHRGIVTML
jgi:hypothetical protein